MTTKEERSRALVIAEAFLIDLLDPKKTPRVPSQVRERARNCLKHYPGMSDFLHLAAIDFKGRHTENIGTLDPAPFLNEIDRRDLHRKQMLNALQPFFRSVSHG